MSEDEARDDAYRLAILDAITAIFDFVGRDTRIEILRTLDKRHMYLCQRDARKP